MLNDFWSDEWRRSCEALGARWQHCARDAVIGQFDVHGVGRVLDVRRRDTPDENVLRFEITVNDLAGM